MNLVPSLKSKGLSLGLLVFPNKINKFLNVLMDELPKHLLLSCNVDHKIEVVFRLAPPFKSPYWLTKKNLQEFKVQINDLMEWGYIRRSKLLYGFPILFVDKKDKKLCMHIDYHTLNKITITNNYPLLLNSQSL